MGSWKACSVMDATRKWALTSSRRSPEELVWGRPWPICFQGTGLRVAGCGEDVPFALDLPRPLSVQSHTGDMHPSHPATSDWLDTGKAPGRSPVPLPGAREPCVTSRHQCGQTRPRYTGHGQPLASRGQTPTTVSTDDFLSKAEGRASAAGTAAHRGPLLPCVPKATPSLSWLLLMALSWHMVSSAGDKSVPRTCSPAPQRCRTVLPQVLALHPFPWPVASDVPCSTSPLLPLPLFGSGSSSRAWG